MTFRVSTFVAGIAFCLTGIAQTEAGFIIRVGDGSVPVFTAGSTGLLPVYILSNVAGEGVGRSLAGYTLAFDFDSAISPGVGFRPGFSAFDTSSSFNLGYTGTVEVDGAADNYDILAGASGPSVNLATADTVPIHLFNLGFQIAANAAAGSYSVIFSPGGTQGGGPINDLDGIGVDSLEPTLGAAAGQFQVAAVPEPITLGALGLLGCGVSSLIARFRRPSKALVTYGL